MIKFLKTIKKKSFFKDGELYDRYVHDERSFSVFGLKLYSNTEVFDIVEINDMDKKATTGFHSKS